MERQKTGRQNDDLQKGKRDARGASLSPTKLVTICGQLIDEKHEIIGISIESKRHN
jgi:hypothetical protein